MNPLKSLCVLCVLVVRLFLSLKDAQAFVISLIESICILSIDINATKVFTFVLKDLAKTKSYFN
jgi:hypothetical protein